MGNMQYKIDGVVFTYGGKKVSRFVQDGAEWIMTNITVRDASGNTYQGIGVFCASDSMEHYQTLLLTDEGIFAQDEDDFFTVIPESGFFPYKYRFNNPNIPENEYNHHLRNGWAC